MLRLFILSLALISGGVSAKEESFTQGGEQGPMYVYHTQDDYGAVKEALEMAIMNVGLRVSGTLHVSDMLNRTGKDLGFKEVYQQAESVEFCSALMSHKMTQASPLNLVICPFTISLYVKADEPDKRYVSFRKIFLNGDNDGKLTAEIEEMLHGIIRQALGLE